MPYNLVKKVNTFVDEIKSMDTMNLKQMMTKTWKKMILKSTKIRINTKEKVEAMNVMSAFSGTFVSTIC